MSTDIKRITKELEDKAANRQKDIDDLQTQIAMDDTQITAAEKAMAEASDQNDVAAYRKAKQSKLDAIDAKEMHEARLTKMTDVPEMNETEYQKVIDDVTEETDQKMAEIRKKVADITAQLYPVQAEMQTDVADANAAMKAAYDMTYPDGKRSNGALISPRDYRKHFDMASWITRAIGNKQERDGK